MGSTTSTPSTPPTTSTPPPPNQPGFQSQTTPITLANYPQTSPQQNSPPASQPLVSQPLVSQPLVSQLSSPLSPITTPSTSQLNWPLILGISIGIAVIIVIIVVAIGLSSRSKHLKSQTDSLRKASTSSTSAAVNNLLRFFTL
jgi:hypothetical protein